MLVDSDSLGGYLRLERERRRVSLQDMVATTKIQLKFLEALERDDYDCLPPTPFVVGFLRAYAQYLALDVDTILAAYRAIYRVPEEPESAQPLVIYPARRAKRLGTIGVIVLVMALLVTVSAIVGEWGPHWRTGTPATSAPLPAQQGFEPAKTALQTPVPAAEQENVPKQTVPAGPASAEVPAGSGPSTTPALPLAPAISNPRASGQAQQRQPPRLKPNTPLVLQAQALKNTWVRVEIDGVKDKRRAVRLASGKSVSWEATERFSLTVGNARGIRVTLNGQEMSLPQTRDNVVRDFLLTRAQLN